MLTVVFQRFLGDWLRRPEILCIAFFLAILPFASQFVFFHPDEMHYVDAGLQMVESGDYLTPRTAEGELRLKKPILPYWFVSCGIGAAGISPLGIRLFFAIAATAMIGIVWRTSLLVHQSSIAATASAVFFAIHPAVIISAPRAVPDMCLAFFLSISFFGFILLSKQAASSQTALWLAFGGGALAILSKGIPALALIVGATVFLGLKRPSLIKQNPLRWLSISLLCVTIASSWFVLMASLHGDALQAEFVDDQLGRDRFATGITQVLSNAPSIAVVLAFTFSVPLSITISRHVWRGLRSANWAGRDDIQLLIVWCVLYFGMASTVERVNVRYLLPLVAPMAVMFGGLCLLLPQPDLTIKLRRWLRAMPALILPILIAFGLLHFSGSIWTATVVPLLVFSGVFWLIIAVYQKTPQMQMLGIGFCFLVGIGMTGWAGRCVANPDPAEALAGRLANRGDRRPILLDDITLPEIETGEWISLTSSRNHPSLGENFAARLRVACENQRPIIRASTLNGIPDLSGYAAVVSTNPTSPFIAQGDGNLETVSLRLDLRFLHTDPVQHFGKPLRQRIAEHATKGILAR